MSKCFLTVLGIELFVLTLQIMRDCHEFWEFICSSVEVMANIFFERPL